ncbi:hypothetical protein ACIPEP_08740 [Curtobacterium sp. NPDC087082]|uniref:hypothetical protein n=1 Tax=Curtobacterium sp. NPDC087082 TaxID=3363966 RepID=UPI0038099E46
MDTGDAPAEDAPPGWVLSTPVRPSEVWTFPALTLVLAGAHVFFGIAFGGLFALVVGVSAAVVTTVGAVALFVANRRAYDEQTVEASWRCHVTRVVVAVTVAAVVTIATVLVGIPFGLFLAAVGLPMRYATARAVPRVDHLAVAWAFVVVGTCGAVLAAVALTVDGLSRAQSASWIASGVFVLVWSALAVHQFRAAARATPDPPWSGVSAPDRTAS